MSKIDIVAEGRKRADVAFANGLLGTANNTRALCDEVERLQASNDKQAAAILRLTDTILDFSGKITEAQQ